MVADLPSHSVGCFFILLVVSFAVQEIFSLLYIKIDIGGDSMAPLP